MKQKIKIWHRFKYPNDELAKEMDGEITFKNLWDGMNAGEDVYEMLGVYDSLIREHVFSELAKRMNTKYETIYNKWLGE